MNQLKQPSSRSRPWPSLLFFSLPLIINSHFVFAEETRTYDLTQIDASNAYPEMPLSLDSLFVPLTRDGFTLTSAGYTFNGNTGDTINYIELCTATDTTCNNCTAGFTTITAGTPFSYLSSGTPYSIRASSLASYLNNQSLGDGTYNIGFYVRSTNQNCSSASCSANSDTNSHLLCMQASYTAGVVTVVAQTDNGTVQLNTPTITPTILANTTVTNAGATGITGDVDVVSGTPPTGAPTINGNVNLGPGGAAAVAQANAVAAYNTAIGLTCPPANNLSGQDLGGKTLVPGVYCFGSSAALTGTLTLAGTSSTSSYTFQIGSTLTTAANAVVTLSGGVTNDNVTWAVGSSATIGADNAFAGIINATTSISVGSGTVIRGRTWAQSGAVTLIINSINPD